MSKKALLLIGNFLSHKGITSPIEELAMYLTNKGWRVFTASIKVFRLFKIVDMLTTTWSNRHYYDMAIVDVYSGPAFVWAEAVCQTLQLAGKPYVLTLHGGSLPVFSKRWPRRVRHLLSSATVVTTPSNYLLETMHKFRSDIKLIPNSLDLSVYHYRVRSQPQPDLVWLRAFHNIYNPQLAPRVLALLAPEFPAIRLSLVGPDKGDGSFQRTQRVAEDLGVSKHLRFPGKIPKDEVSLWMNQGDIFLNTTNVDNTPVSVLEAMACGLCVVSTNVGGIPYLLDHETDALLVPPDDPEAMAVAVRRILTEPGLAHHLSANARRKAEQFDWSYILPKWENLLTGWLKSKSIGI